MAPAMLHARAADWCKSQQWCSDVHCRADIGAARSQNEQRLPDVHGNVAQRRVESEMSCATRGIKAAAVVPQAQAVMTQQADVGQKSADWD